MKFCTVGGASEFSGDWVVGVKSVDVWFWLQESVIHTPRAPVIQMLSKSSYLMYACT